MLFSRNSKRDIHIDHDVYMDGDILQRSRCVKYLGIIIDDWLYWKKHIEYISLKFVKVNGTILKVRNILPRRTLISMYNVFGYPYLLYCNLTWESTYFSNLKRLEYVQK